MASKKAIERLRQYALLCETGDGSWVVTAWRGDAAAALSKARELCADGQGGALVARVEAYQQGNGRTM